MDLFSCQLNIAIMTVIISTMVPKKRTFPGGPRDDETAPPGWGGFLFGAMVEPE